MPNPVKATPLVTGDQLANSLQPANVALAELIESVRRLEPAIRDTGKASDESAKQLAGATISLGTFSTGLSRSSVLLGLATSQFASFTSAVSSGIASAVGAFDPSAVKRWELTVRDLHAVFGDIFRPVLERANVVVRSLADGIESLSPSAKTMVAALAVAGVSMVTMTAVTAAFSAVVATATGGLSLALGAAAGAITAVGAGVGSMALSMAEFKDTVRELAAAGSVVVDVFGRMAADMLVAMKPNIQAAAEMAVELGRFAATAAEAAKDLDTLTGALGNFTTVLQLSADGVHAAATALRFLTNAARELLRLPPLRGIGGSEGKAVADVRFGSPEDAWREAIKNAFSIGNTTQKPEEATAKGVGDIYGLLKDWDNFIRRNITGPVVDTNERSNRAVSETPFKYLSPTAVVDRLRQKYD